VGLNTTGRWLFWLLIAASWGLKLAALDAAVQCRCCGAVQMGIKSTRIEEDICQSQTMPSCRQRNVLQHFNVSATFYENPVCPGDRRGAGWGRKEGVSRRRRSSLCLHFPNTNTSCPPVRPSICNSLGEWLEWIIYKFNWLWKWSWCYT